MKHLQLQKQRSERTIETYTRILFNFLAYSETRETAQLSTFGFSVQDLRGYIRDRAGKIQASTQALWVSAIRSYLKWIQTERPEDASPQLAQILREFHRPKVATKNIQIFDEEDLNLLLKHIASRPLRERVLFELLYGLGLRVSEAAGLKLIHFDTNEGTVKVKGKGGKIRILPLTPILNELVQELKDPIWGQNDDPQMLRGWVRHWGYSVPLGKEGSLRLHPHKLRHSIASHLLRRGVALPQIQKFLGHKRLSTTQRYTHLRTEDIVKVYDNFFPKNSLRKDNKADE